MSLIRQSLVVVMITAAIAQAQNWPDGKELSGRLLDLARLDRAGVQEIGRSAGGQKLRLLEIAPAVQADEDGPAILVLANLEGDLPLCSLTAVELAAEVLAAPDDSPAARVRWYVLPLANPDGLDRWFDRPRAPGGHNRTAVGRHRLTHGVEDTAIGMQCEERGMLDVIDLALQRQQTSGIGRVIDANPHGGLVGVAADVQVGSKTHRVTHHAAGIQTTGEPTDQQDSETFNTTRTTELVPLAGSALTLMENPALADRSSHADSPEVELQEHRQQVAMTRPEPTSTGGG